MDYSQFPAFKKFMNRPILAVDFGTKFTGLATFIPGKDPFPLAYGRIAYKNDEQLIKEIQKIISQEDIEVLVFGIPRFTDGKESKMTETVREFYTKLCQNLDIEHYEQDETLSTFEAKDRMQNSPRYNFKVDMTKIDELAATIILEDFIRNSSFF